MTTAPFPASNLSSASQAWVRRVESEVEENARELANLNLTTLGNNRSSAGQLGVIGRTLDAVATQQSQIASQQSQIASQQSQIAAQQSELSTQIEELNYRTNTTVTAANLSVSPPAGGAWAFATRNITIPGRGGVSRMAYIGMSASLATSGSGELAQNSRLMQGSRILGELGYSADIGVGISNVIVVPAGGTTLAFRLGAQRFSGTPTLNATNIEVNVLYGGPS